CGMIISYIPQHYRIISTKSSDGISPWFLLLGCVSATCSLFNILILQRTVIDCCHEMTGFNCFASMLGIIQLSLQWLMFTLIFILFMIYFPPHRKIVQYVRHLHFNSPPTNWSSEWRISVGVATTVTLHFVLTALISLYLVSIGGLTTRYWADILGVISMFFASIQYLPQIWRTWRRKSVGALSIPMMLMQTPGSFLFTYLLAVRPGTRWTTWIVFLVTGCLQGTLLIMCICWHYRAKRLGYGPFNVGERDLLVGRDGKPLVQDERARLLEEESAISNNYGNLVSNDDILE
ncbi:7469_t:CDS:2, partial [Acaulospora morrowiae]